MEFISFLLSIVVYIFSSLGYYRISESLNLGNSWMTFVPIVNLFKLGEISDTLRGQEGKPDKKRRIVLPISTIIVSILMVVAMLFAFLFIGIGVEEDMVGLAILGFIGIFFSFIFLIIPTIIQYMCIYDIFKKYTKEATLFLILSIIFPYVLPFLIFFACDPTKPQNYYNPGSAYNPNPMYNNQNTVNYEAAPQKPYVEAEPVQQTQTPPSYVQPPVDAQSAGDAVNLNKPE